MKKRLGLVVRRALRDLDVLTANLDHLVPAHPAYEKSTRFTLRNFAGFDSISRDLEPLVRSNDLRLLCLDPRESHLFSSKRDTKWLVAALDEAIELATDGEVRRLERRSFRVVRAHRLEILCTTNSKGPCRVALQGPIDD